MLSELGIPEFFFAQPASQYSAEGFIHLCFFQILENWKVSQFWRRDFPRKISWKIPIYQKLAEPDV